jgi:cell division protease FtsH
MPDTDRVRITKQQALSRIVMAMAGRAAQEVFLSTVDAGASNDFMQAADMARRMVATWGMSRVGPIFVGEQAQGPFGGGGSSTFGQDFANEIDREVRYITNMCYKAAVAIVKADSERIEALVKILLEKETVLADEWQDLLKQYPSAIDWSALALPQTEPNIE